MGRWYLVRHAMTQWNREGRVQGHAGPPLDEPALAQASRVAESLREVEFAAAYCSDLPRATQTAEVILEGRNIEPRPAPELREFAYGAWEGLTHSEVQERYPDQFADSMRASIDFAAPGGESARDVLGRTLGLRDRLVATHAVGEELLLVGHSGSLKGMLVALLGLDPKHFWRFRLVPGSISIVSVHGADATLDLWNDTSHLEGLDG